MNRTGQILHSSYAIKKAYDGLWDKIQDTYALTRVEIDVLSFLANNPDCDTASCIVEYRKIAKSHVSGAVESLLERGWIRREQDTRDRRCIHLKLTDCASAAVEDILNRQREFGAAIREGITEEEMNTFSRMLEKLTANARKLSEE